MLCEGAFCDHRTKTLNAGAQLYLGVRSQNNPNQFLVCHCQVISNFVLLGQNMSQTQLAYYTNFLLQLDVCHLLSWYTNAMQCYRITRAYCTYSADDTRVNHDYNTVLSLVSFWISLCSGFYLPLPGVCLVSLWQNLSLSDT